MEYCYAVNIQAIEHFLPTYFKDWYAQVKRDDLDTPELPRQDSLEYCQEMITYLKSLHYQTQLEYPSLSEKDRNEVDGLLFFFRLDLENHRGNISAFDFHLSDKIARERSFQKDWLSPELHTVAALIDYMVTYKKINKTKQL